MNKLYVSQPFLPPLEEFLPSLQEIWNSKVLTNGGPFHQKFETELTGFLGAGHVSLFANATIGLITALQALKISGEVITTPYSFVATSHALTWNNIKPVFVDIDPATLNIDPARIEAAITPQTQAILAVHCYGRPCDVEAIQRIADRYNLKVIYDAAHAFGANWHGGSLLQHGDLSVLSFHATKLFNTFEGGAIVSNTQKMKVHVDHLKNFGFVDEVTVVTAGINGKMSEFNAALGSLQLKYFPQVMERRKTIHDLYVRHLSQIKGISLLEHTEAAANHAYFPILVEADYPLSRDALYEAFKTDEIYARRYFYPLISEFPSYRGLASSSPNNLPVATAVSRKVLCLPIYPDLSETDQMRVIDFLKSPTRT